MLSAAAAAAAEEAREEQRGLLPAKLAGMRRSGGRVSRRPRARRRQTG